MRKNDQIRHRETKPSQAAEREKSKRGLKSFKNKCTKALGEGIAAFFLSVASIVNAQSFDAKDSVTLVEPIKDKTYIESIETTSQDKQILNPQMKGTLKLSKADRDRLLNLCANQLKAIGNEVYKIIDFCHETDKRITLADGFFENIKETEKVLELAKRYVTEAIPNLNMRDRKNPSTVFFLALNYLHMSYVGLHQTAKVLIAPPQKAPVDDTKFSGLTFIFADSIAA